MNRRVVLIIVLSFAGAIAAATLTRVLLRSYVSDNLTFVISWWVFMMALYPAIRTSNKGSESGKQPGKPQPAFVRWTVTATLGAVALFFIGYLGRKFFFDYLPKLMS